jgi:plasmid stabilization system protein ParE
MRAFLLTPQAEDDLFEIWIYIARDSIQAAMRVEAALLEACALLAGTPLAGHVRREMTARPLRFWTVPRFPSYIVVYDPLTEPLRVIRILHARRDLAAVLE